MLIDSHCHLDFFPQKEEKSNPANRLPTLETILDNAAKANIKILLTIATELQKQNKLIEICNNSSDNPSDNPSPQIFCSTGTHPTYLNNNPIPTAEQLLQQIQTYPKIIALGESGLDFFRPSNPNKNTQVSALTQHIIAAQEAKTQGQQIPLIIHNRNADEDIETILAKEQKRKAFPCLLHCFAASQRLARAALEMGCYLSFTGLVTYPKCEPIREIVRITPLSRMLLETDAPFLSPVPHRSRACQPAYLPLTAQRIAEVKDLPLETIIAETGQNFLRLFPKASRETAREGE